MSIPSASLSASILPAQPDQRRNDFARCLGYEEYRQKTILSTSCLDIPSLLRNSFNQGLDYAMPQKWYESKYPDRNYVVIERVRKFGFYFDNVERLINESETEINALNILFDDTGLPRFEIRPMHVTYAKDKGYLVLAEELNDSLIAKAEAETTNEAGFDEIDVDFQRAEKRKDPVTAILKNRYDDVEMLKRIQRIGHEKFSIHHAMLARKQDLPLTEKFIRKTLT